MGFWSGVKRQGPMSRLETAALVTAIALGALMFCVTIRSARRKNLLEYTFGNDEVAVDRIRSALLADFGVIGGYVLVLGSLAFIAWRLAVSGFGSRLSWFVGVSVVLAGVADLFENAGLYLRTLEFSEPHQRFLATATAAAATVKWCALLAAIVAVPAALISLRLWGHARRQAVRDRHNNADWWVNCWQGAELPEVNPADIKEDEWAWVNAYNVPGIRDVMDSHPGEPVQSICLSGGGVRSACVAMGALQALSGAGPYGVRASADGTVSSEDDDAASIESAIQKDEPSFLDSVDYIISVSGGGYTAGARLLAALSKPSAKALAGKAATGTPTSRRDSERPLRLSELYGEGSVELDHFRRNSSYIADSVPALIRTLAVVLKNLLASVVTLFWIPVALGFLVGYLLAYLPLAAFVPVRPPDPADPSKAMKEDAITAIDNYFPSLVHHPAGWWAVGIFGVCAVAFLGAALGTEMKWWDDRSERRRIKFSRIAGATIVFGVFVFAITVAMPALMRAFSSVDVSGAQIAGAVGGVLGLQYFTAIVAMVWRNRSKIPLAQAGKRSWRQKLPPGIVPLVLVLLTLIVLLAVWLIVLASVAAGVFGYLTQPIGGEYRQVPWVLLWLGVLGVLLALLCVADVTSLSLQPFYRERLARTFAVRRKVSLEAGGSLPDRIEAQRYPESEPTWLYSHGKLSWSDQNGHDVEYGPKFVFSAAAAVSGDGKPAPGLNAVSFALTANHIGGPDLGWLKTEELLHACPARIRRDLTVQTAVAVSGAAFASAMGRQNKGTQKLLAVSGARLGTWLPNPWYIGRLFDVDGKGLLTTLPSVRGFTYFYRELLGINTKSARLVQVTDGGHYENLGLVEALRRRSRLVICIDGGGDQPPLLSGLADAMRLAKNELGVEIELEDESSFGAQVLAPGSGDPFGATSAFARLNKRISDGMVTKGKIVYPAASGLPEDQREGILIFGKAVLWRKCPDWLLTYAAGSEVFPHDSTSDQWFSESQFGAYTELGRLLGKNVVEALKTL